MPPYLGWDDAIEMIFDGGMVAENDLAYWSLQPTEIKAVALVDLPTASELVTPLAFRRLTLAVALGPNEMAYTEDGRHRTICKMWRARSGSDLAKLEAHVLEGDDQRVVGTGQRGFAVGCKHIGDI